MEAQKTCYLFFDFDGTVTADIRTTLPDGSEKMCRILPECHLNSLRSVHDAGHKIFICTGRSRGSMLGINKDWLPALDLPWDGMLFGASDMWYNGKRISIKYIPREEIYFWLDYCKNTGRVFCYNGTETPIRYDFSMETSPDRVAEIYRDVERQIIENPLTNMSVIPSALDIDSKKTSLSVVNLKRYSDIFPPGANKGQAIKHFCKLINAPMEQTICFGDSENDIDMFKVCNSSVAMKNSPDSLKKLATYSAKSDFGVSEAIKLFFGI